MGVEETFQLIFDELRQSTQASEQNCREVAQRLANEVQRICNESKRIQASGEVQNWATTLAHHRLQQCLQYYQLGRRRGAVELHSTLSAIVYRYITPHQIPASYQARLSLIEDFLQGFYVEALNAFRRESSQLTVTYRPHTLLELAEYMAFSERYGKRRIPLPGNRSQQLIVLRSQTFSQQQPLEISVDMDTAAEGSALESDSSWNNPVIQGVRDLMAQEPEPRSATLYHAVIKELMAYLEEREQNDCADYFTLRLQDLSASEIEKILDLTPRQRDYLQQRFKYHLIRFALSHKWELVHQWLEADLESNLGLTAQQWQDFHTQIGGSQSELLQLKQKKLSNSEIAQALGCTVSQVEKRWFKLLELAWEIRNQ